MTAALELVAPTGLSLMARFVPAESGSASDRALVEQTAGPRPRRGCYQATLDTLAIGRYWLEVSLSSTDDLLAAGWFERQARDEPQFFPVAVATTVGLSGMALAQLAATSITTLHQSPIDQGILIVRGCDHQRSQGTAWSWQNEAADWPDLSQGTLALEIAAGSTTAIGTGVAVSLVGPVQSVAAELTRTASAALLPGEGRYLLVHTGPTGIRSALAFGHATIVDWIRDE